MSEITLEQVKNRVELVLSEVENPLDFRVAPNGIYQVDGRWWVVLEAGKEPVHRSQVWDRLAEIEEKLDSDEMQVMVTAA